MTDKLLHLPKPYFPKLHRPRLNLKRRYRHAHDEGQAADSHVTASHAVQPEDDKDENGDEPLPAVQRMQAESSELITLFKLPESEVCTSPPPPRHNCLDHACGQCPAVNPSRGHFSAGVYS